MPTALFASFGAGEDQRTFQIRVEPGAMDLRTLADLEDIADAVAAGALAPDAGGLRVDAAMAAPGPYAPWLTTISFAVTSAAAARFFGGGAPEVAAAAGVGLVIGLLSLLAGRLTALGRVFEAVGAFAAALLSCLAARAFAPVSVYITIVAGIIVLVPGFTLTVAMTELAARYPRPGCAWPAPSWRPSG